MKRILLLLSVVGLAAGAVAQPNITWHQYPNWSFPLVPTDAPHTSPDILLPPVLHGDLETTYWNLSFTNAGDATSGHFAVNYYLDGILTYVFQITSAPPGQLYYSTDVGPWTVRGGRHVGSILCDADGEVAESDETDNAWGRQFAWAPSFLASGQTVVRAEPPALTGGWEHVAGSPPHYNCDGLGFTSALPWNAVVLRSASLTADDDLALYEIPADRDDSYITAVASSANYAGRIDVVLVNRNQAGNVAWDVGVRRFSGQGESIVSLVESRYLNTGDTVADAFAADEFFKIRQLTIGPGDTGPRLISADAAPGSALQLVVYGADVVTGSLYASAAAHEEARADGTLRLLHDFATPGDYAVAVFRHPMDGTGPVDFTWRDSAETPDLAVHIPAGWHGALTPRDTDDATAGWAPLPAAPLGSTTWMNHALVNAGGSAAAGVRIVGQVDGAPAGSTSGFFRQLFDPLGPGAAVVSVNHSPQAIPGGRHTLSYTLDPDDTIYEVDESNNTTGRQYVWAPRDLVQDEVTVEALPGHTAGGYDTFDGPGVYYHNCNGYRLQGNAAWWRLVAVANAVDDDLDISLHPPATDAQTGFDVALQSSAQLGAYVDYLLVNDNVGPKDPVDVGVFSFFHDSSEFLMQSVASTIVSDPAAAPIGPGSFDGEDLAQVWDVWLDADVYSFQLDNLAGAVDWSLVLHPSTLRYQGRSNIVFGGESYDNGPGVGEVMDVEVTVPGWYALVVSRSTAANVGQSGTYRIRVGRGGTAVDPVPAPTALRLDASPNPFNPATRIAFELPAAADVFLDVYDVQGTRVRTLAAGRRGPGRHELAWDGRDAAGQAVPSGTYMAQLRTGDARVLRKLTLLK